MNLVIFFIDPCLRKKCQYNGICVSVSSEQAVCKCPDCPNMYSPVCGNDGQTYSSECALASTSCKQQKDIFVFKQNSCGESTSQ